MRGRNRNKRGFTLIELIIVITILGILALYALPKYQEIIKEARSAEARAQLSSFRSALGIYYAKNHGVYPSRFVVKRGDIFADGRVPEVEVTNSRGKVVRSAAVKTTRDGDGVVEPNEVNYNSGWVYDDGHKLDPKYSKADVRINYKARDPVTGKHWYEY